MAEEKPSAERTEEPTPRRRQEDLEKGDAVASQEASIAASLFVLFVVTVWLLPHTAPRLLHSFQEAFSNLDLIDATGRRVWLDRGYVVEVIRSSGARLVTFVAPVGLFAMASMVLVHVLQAGLRFTPGRLGFKWSKLDPVQGIKRVFSAQFFVTVFKSLAKGVGVIAIAVYALREQPSMLWMLSFGSEGRLPVHLRDIGLAVLVPVTGALVALAALDFAWMRYRKEEGLKMSKQEIRDEMKSDVGDPQIRQARRQRMKELVLGQPLPEKMKEATVVATNPTHYAVALRYWPERDKAPRVIAKGTGFRAAKIRELAAENGVPIIEDKPLARGLYALVKEDSVVPRELFEAVAQLLAIVYRRREGLS